MQQLHDSGALRASLDVSDPKDREEREAERVADAVLQGNEATHDGRTPTVTCRAGDGTSGNGTLDSETEAEIRSVTTGGRPLPEPTRSFFESRFGQDFSDVRVHTGSQAAASAELLEAEAYTVGQHVVLGAGNYAPRTESGRKLLAHELTHVVQGSPTMGKRVTDVSQPSDPMEQEAERAARAVMRRGVGEITNRQDQSRKDTQRSVNNANFTINQDYALQVARKPSDETTGTNNIRMFIAPTVVIPGSEPCPSDPKVLKEVIDQVNQHTDDKLVPILQSMKKAAGQTTMASKGAGLLEKFVGKVGQVSMWVADFVATFGEQAAGDVADALSSDIQRIRDFLTNAEANAQSGDAIAARIQINEAYGLLARNLYWIKYRDKRPSPKEYDIFQNCTEEK
jgi:hypothetical protein